MRIIVGIMAKNVETQKRGQAFGRLKSASCRQLYGPVLARKLSFQEIVALQKKLTASLTFANFNSELRKHEGEEGKADLVYVSAEDVVVRMDQGTSPA